MRVTVIVDASFCSRSKAGGWACWIAGDIGERIKHSAQFKKKPQTSTEAEILGAINAVILAYKAGGRDILLQSDCKGVGHAMEKRPLWKKIQAQYFPDAKVTYRHVPGHTLGTAAREYVNNWCDIQAKIHMRYMRRGQPTPQHAYAKELANG